MTTYSVLFEICYHRSFEAVLGSAYEEVIFKGDKLDGNELKQKAAEILQRHNTDENRKALKPELREKFYFAMVRAISHCRL